MCAHKLAATLLLALLAACSAPTPKEPLKGHLSADQARPPVAAAGIPSPVQQTLALPAPKPAAKVETYSVVVHNVRVEDLLFALARDAKLNVDIHPGISGSVSLNAIDQTLPQLLSRIAKQVDMRFELDGPNLVVMPDSPFLKHYKVDYVNLSRNVSGTVATNTQISTGNSGNTNESSLGSGNISSTRVENTSKNQFWESLEKNIKDILRETDKVLPEGSAEEEEEFSGAFSGTPNPQAATNRNARTGSNTQPSLSEGQTRGTRVVRRTTFREAASVIINPESGVVTVRATGRQHERIQEFIDRVINSARRQVMIEATIVEVELADGYQQGIQWSRLREDGSGFSVSPASVQGGPESMVMPFVLTYLNTSNPLSISIVLDLLQSFGTTKVLSSPRLSVLNNQTALLKVVENYVYFNVKADTVTTANVGTNTTVTTTPQSVSVGLVMTVTPQVSENDTVILNVRPTISSIAALKEDPNPSIPSGIKNYVPQIRTREIESVLRVSSGDIAVLGGLMEDTVDYKTGRVPILGNIPIAGELFTTRNNSARKSELVIFLRPVVIRDPSLSGDYAAMRGYLPGSGFFTPPPEAQPFNPALGGGQP